MPNIIQRWNQYQPSKPVWLWSSVGAAVLTMVLGFGTGGWQTSSNAAKHASVSTEKAVAQFAAAICANRFMAATDAKTALASLKAAESWKRDRVLEEAGWVTFAKMQKPVTGAAELCVTQLLATDSTSPTGGA